MKHYTVKISCAREGAHQVKGGFDSPASWVGRDDGIYSSISMARSSSNTCSYCVSEWAVQGAVVLGALGEESRSGVSLLQILKCPWENEDRLGGRARGICHGQSRVIRHLVIPTYLPPIQPFSKKNPQLENLKCWPVSHPLSGLAASSASQSPARALWLAFPLPRRHDWPPPHV